MKSKTFTVVFPLCTAMMLLTALLAVLSTVHSCDDVNTVACQQLDRVMNVCTHQCFSTFCQRYCGKCRKMELAFHFEIHERKM